MSHFNVQNHFDTTRILFLKAYISAYLDSKKPMIFLNNYCE